MDFRIIGEERISQCPIRSTSPSHYYRHGGCGCFEMAVQPIQRDADGTVIQGNLRAVAMEKMAQERLEGTPGGTVKELILAKLDEAYNLVKAMRLEEAHAVLIEVRDLME